MLDKQSKSVPVKSMEFVYDEGWRGDTHFSIRFMLALIYLNVKLWCYVGLDKVSVSRSFSDVLESSSIFYIYKSPVSPLGHNFLFLPMASFSSKFALIKLHFYHSANMHITVVPAQVTFTCQYVAFLRVSLVQFF